MKQKTTLESNMKNTNAITVDWTTKQTAGDARKYMKLKGKSHKCHLLVSKLTVRNQKKHNQEEHQTQKKPAIAATQLDTLPGSAPISNNQQLTMKNQFINKEEEQNEENTIKPNKRIMKR